MKTLRRFFAFGISLILLSVISITVFADGSDDIEAIPVNGYQSVTAKSVILMEATTG